MLNHHPFFLSLSQKYDKTKNNTHILSCYQETGKHKILHPEEFLMMENLPSVRKTLETISVRLLIENDTVAINNNT